jgi:hypothetical protein
MEKKKKLFACPICCCCHTHIRTKFCIFFDYFFEKGNSFYFPKVFKISLFPEDDDDERARLFTQTHTRTRTNDLKSSHLKTHIIIARAHVQIDPRRTTIIITATYRGVLFLKFLSLSLSLCVEWTSSWRSARNPRRRRRRRR